MGKSIGPSQDRVRELFHYDPETGIFTRRKPSRQGDGETKYGRIGAGRISELGYVMLMIDNTNYIAGRVAWLYVHGEWPERIKYINGIQVDNRLSNLRTHNDRGEIKERKLSQERLKELLHYEPETGWFTWRVSSSMANPGDRAGGLHGYGGYRAIGLDYRKYLEHTLAWLYMTGTVPQKEIDHINNDAGDNRWSNLREATRSQNGHNKPRGRGATFPGVVKHGNKWRSRIQIEGETTDYGCFRTIAEARVARLLGEKEKFGRFTTWIEDRDSKLPMGDLTLNLVLKDGSLWSDDALGLIEIVTVNHLTEAYRGYLDSQDKKLPWSTPTLTEISVDRA